MTNISFQIVTLRLLCMGHTAELMGAEESLKVATLEKSLKEKEAVIIDVTAKMKSGESEIANLQDQIRSLQGQIKEHDNEKGRMTSQIHELENDVLEMFATGFDRAVSQVVAFAPEFDVGKLDVTKIVVNRELVEDEADELEDENAAPVDKEA
ncbi:uncharacterized protein LOC110265772 [Arachis ipaensis]|uniref:uncharacterized protein LOC110265772 n=1 Tax=Arachis ipaensis TaxID=130454 RepID=UPI000A2AFFD9|nr:uncharacterized protein LOC110265772 [Arachis ipaensis]XP_025673821.1 uncharacterized protein LOC112772997 [Arachis hypogaea]QHN95916.1 uncharacterized protein DS421_18g613860 [Arachis hypogaea]